MNGKLKSTLINYLFVLPAVLIFAIFYIYPFLKVFQLSMVEWDGILPTMQFIGLDNFKEIMQDKIWWDSMWHAGYITLIALTFQNGLALLLALVCDREIKGRNFFRVLFFVPPILSEVVVGLVWQWILDGNYGILNNLLSSIGLHSLVHNWLSDPKTALTCIAIVHSWKGFGWGFIIMLAGLQTIPRQLYEAARVDGAGSWQMFSKVTLPLMIPVFSMVVILTILGSMQVFVLIIAMVGQGLVYHTTVPVLRILGAMTGSSRFGYACAQGIIFGLILIIISFTQKKFSEKIKQA
ncbi:MAG: sugar ABC transporter permease [Candidatus Omnitrophica bacterium CG11_big_fil_rev_8_21_14_0_20_42_13]|uniref:Sugar ABC transporter permease n=1 Tax=Candidatus Ghiorseimicrobium undicola TaxID=1974746 RepID=A0A2H0M080_9BACT|nr:MAG: sugar ABC transporter permease [Candidatus Omnitrophica bacterium CG11_big_fil_rev_8_21_14_0_20_42_13]